MDEKILPVGTKVMVMSKTRKHHNRTITTIDSVADENNFYCRKTKKYNKFVGNGEIHYRVSDVLTYQTQQGHVETPLRRSSLLVIDDKTDGTSFEDMMSNLTDKAHA